MGIIVSSFVGCGKHFMMSSNHEGIKIVDCGEIDEDTDIDGYIEKAVGENVWNDITFVSYSEAVRDALCEKGIDFDVFYPSLDRKNELIELQVAKRTKPSAIAMFDHMYEKMVESIEARDNEHEHKHCLSNKGEFLGNNELILKYFNFIKGLHDKNGQSVS